ncbi:MAG: class I SAM-dependent methyltransferase [Solirubrobacterales bacterium]
MSETAASAAAAQAELWGDRSADWAEIMEGWSGWGVPVYRRVLACTAVAPGTRLLDVGCGAGRCARMAADRGASVAGLDATTQFIEIARTRVPDGDFRAGSMESLPWDDHSFDVVTGFNSFFIADDMVAALREAGRVVRPGGQIALTVFGRPQNCRSTEVFASLARLHSGSASSQPEPKPLYELANLEQIGRAAGLSVEISGYIAFSEHYPDVETMLRGYMAAAPFVRASRVFGDEAVRDSLADALNELKLESGEVRLDDEVAFLVVRT